jgi:hypothetical protein
MPRRMTERADPDSAPAGKNPIWRRPVARLGIVFRLILVLIIALLPLLLALLIIDRDQRRIADGLERISSQQLPALILTDRLLKESYQLASQGPDILIARAGPLGLEFDRMHQGLRGEWDEWIERLRGHGIGDRDAELLRRHLRPSNASYANWRISPGASPGSSATSPRESPACSIFRSVSAVLNPEWMIRVWPVGGRPRARR